MDTFSDLNCLPVPRLPSVLRVFLADSTGRELPRPLATGFFKSVARSDAFHRGDAWASQVPEDLPPQGKFIWNSLDLNNETRMTNDESNPNVRMTTETSD